VPSSGDVITARGDTAHGTLEAVKASTVVAGCLAPGEEAWLVGGAVRDALLGRPTRDLDFAVRGDAERLARRVADLLDGAFFTYSEAFSTYRVVLPGGAVDFAPLRGPSLEDDLRARDFTIDALALQARAGDPGGRVGVSRPIDPLDGAADLRARRLRLCSDGALSADPLRVLRLARLAAELDLETADELLARARAAAPGLADVSGERVAHELTALLGLRPSARAVRLLDRTGGLEMVLPELGSLKGCVQNPYHHLDVYGHTLEALEHLPGLVDQMGGERFLAPPEACGLRGAPPLAPLAWATLLHDVGKPAVRKVDHEGRIIFWHHDEVGARMADDIARRLGMSRRFSCFLGVLVLNHLRLGFLVRESPLTRRALVRYRRAVEPYVFESVLLSLADRLATRGEKTPPTSLAKHYRLARQVWLEIPKETRPLPLGGADVMNLLGLPEGPAVGEALTALQDEVDAGEVCDVQQARAFLIAWAVDRQSGGDTGDG
jgi:putative nucleotidyltransferase with HDIG domain